MERLWTASDTIIISGAGIAGLALAYELERLGVPHLILEQDPEAAFRNQGYALTITPSTLEYFSQSGILPHVQKHLTVMSDGYTTHLPNGDLCSVDKKSQPYHVIPRFQLRQIYLDQIDKNNNVFWGCRVTSFEQQSDRRIKVFWENETGRKYYAIVANLIATDGINSPIREQIVQDHKHYLGVVAVYGLVPTASVPKSYQSKEFQVVDAASKFRLFAKPFNKNFYNWQVFFPWDKAKPLPHLDQMRHAIQSQMKEHGWAEEYVDFIANTRLKTMRQSLLHDRAPVQPLTDETLLVTLMGDAAHPMSPYKGRGANLALQGVRTYVRILRDQNLTTSPDWDKINRLYEQAHWEEAGKMQTSCRKSVYQNHFFF